MTDLELKDILLINATIIAGAFILLSIITISASNASIFYTKLTAIAVASVTIIIFCWSSYQAMKESPSYPMKLMRNGFFAIMLFGFLFLVIAIVTFVLDITNMIPILTNITKS